MSYTLGILLLVIGIILSVALHELGHMIPAKKFGAIVPQYMVGFGPTIWSTTRGGTEYGIKWILLGGYVRILGMFRPALPGQIVGKYEGEPISSAAYAKLPSAQKNLVKLTLAEEARQSAAQEIPRGAVGQPFYQLPAWQKLIVMFGGPVMNLFLAGLCVVISFGAIGINAPTNTLAAVPKCAQKQCPSAASAAGLTAGDTIVRIGTQQVTDWNEVLAGIRAARGKTEQFTVRRDGALKTVQITVPQGEVPIGVVSRLERKHFGPGEQAKVLWEQFTGTMGILARLPMQLWHTFEALTGAEERSATGVVSVVGVGRIAGELAATPKVGILDKIAALVSLWGSVNMALFAFNLIPLLPLDGGHILGAFFEGARRRVAKLRSRPNPGPVDTARLMPLTYVVIGIFLFMTVLLVAADLLVPVTI
ncbi:MAG: site-2 protease family protein [Actinomycetaceae bacterium]|nr:site-2 protease family protein [Actinomycetaceae bacterium]